jgi:3'-phosphoadenosine 5'-phosphosulfate sulfotransferase (PAPS reductase)/FAD synthetase
MKKIICWWSGGITSAVACKIAIDLYGKENCQVIMLDTKNEHEDTYRFLKDCEVWYDLKIELLSAIPENYNSIEDVWYKHKQLNTANGAVCSYKLKRKVREDWEKQNEWQHQIFGFEFEKKEFNRATSIALNHPQTKPIFPLLMYGLDKKDCIKIVQEAGLEIPEAYKLGYLNNNCLNTGCISGGIGYWQKIQREQPGKFSKMAKIEHDLTEIRGYQVTMLKDQSKEAKAKIKETEDKRAGLVFLKKHKDYPYNKCIDDMQGREPEPLTDCNGFCGVNDLIDVKAKEDQLNFEV